MENSRFIDWNSSVVWSVDSKFEKIRVLLDNCEFESQYEIYKIVVFKNHYYFADFFRWIAEF